MMGVMECRGGVMDESRDTHRPIVLVVVLVLDRGVTMRCFRRIRYDENLEGQSSLTRRDDEDEE